jgi:cell wall-associated NlpC family hydrolase
VQHRRPTDRRSLLRAVGALVLAGALGSTVLAAAGGSRRDVPADVLQIARQQLGDPYQWGGQGPDGWDCSGLTSYMWREVGGVEDIPRVSRDQAAWAVPIPREQLLVGDLVFFGNPVSHVALYSGNGMIVDASSALKKVVERKIWTSGVVRYGRVPRPGMPAVKPWTPPPPPPAPSASPAPAAPARAQAPAAPPAPAGPTLVAATARLVPLKGLPAPDLPAATAVAARAARNATTVTGSRNWTDLALVRVAWHHAGGGDLPATVPALVAASRPVPLGQARIGDLVVYGQPASHVGYYLGHGYMVDASPSLKRVVVRRVFVSPTVRIVRPSAR